MKLDSLRGRLAARRDEIRRLAIGVLAGGGSNERDVSLISGRAVAKALQEAGYRAELLSVSPDNLTLELQPSVDAAGSEALPEGDNAIEPAGETSLVTNALKRVGMVVTTMHGTKGEDGVWQGLLELLGVPYVSAGVKGSALAMDKLVSKRLFTQLGIPTPDYWVCDRGQRFAGVVPESVDELVAKPVAEGSSVGIAMVGNNADGWAVIEGLAVKYGRMLVEKRIYGKELTAGVIGHSDEPISLPLVEIKPTKREFYDFTAKYTKGETEYECPADLAPVLAQRVQEHARTIFREFELAPYARVDCLLDEAGTPWFLEANTLPGFTPLSLLPQAAQAVGIGFAELVELVMLIALERSEARGGDG